MTQIHEAALAFQRLLAVEYIFHLGHKNKLHNLKLSFSPTDFMHLAGLHKLIDIQERRKKAGVVFQEILENPLKTEKMYSRSQYYNSLQDRLYPLLRLEETLDSLEYIFFSYRSNNHNFSKIKADYLIKTKIELSDAFIFLISNLETFNCCSIFCNPKFDYSKQQTKFTVLLKQKILLSDQSLLSEYIRPGYSP